MKLFLLRHGIAVEQGTNRYAEDADRPLTTEGSQKVKLAAQAMQKLDISFQLILSSPYVRARETAEIVADVLGMKKTLRLTPCLVPHGTFENLIDLIRALEPLPEKLLLVGHEPFMSKLISLLISGRPDTSVTLKKGGFCKLSIGSLKNGRCAALDWLLTPRQMGRIG